MYTAQHMICLTVVPVNAVSMWSVRVYVCQEIYFTFISKPKLGYTENDFMFRPARMDICISRLYKDLNYLYVKT